MKTLNQIFDWDTEIVNTIFCTGKIYILESKTYYKFLEMLISIGASLSELEL